MKKTLLIIALIGIVFISGCVADTTWHKTGEPVSEEEIDMLKEELNLTETTFLPRVGIIMNNTLISLSPSEYWGDALLICEKYDEEICFCQIHLETDYETDKTITVFRSWNETKFYKYSMFRKAPCWDDLI